MPNAPTQNLNTAQFMLVNVVDVQEDGGTVDSTEVLTVQSGNDAICTASIDPANNRRVKIVGVSVGDTQVVVGAPGVPAANQLVIPVHVTTAPPNLSRIDFNGSTGPFPQ